MLIDFAKVDTKVIEHFKGGEKSFAAKMVTDDLNKIIYGRLIPGASIGMHTHEGNSEIIYVLEGQGKMLTDGGEERLHAGLCHYCPQGHAHSFVNDSDADLVFFAVVPEHN